MIKALIVGAGIGGLTTAIALEHKGVEVEIYERSAEIHAVGAGLTLWANAIAVFTALGMRDALLELGTYEGQGAIRNARGGILNAAKINDQNVDASIDATIVHRAELHQLLYTQVQSEIHLGHDVIRYAPAREGNHAAGPPNWSRRSTQQSTAVPVTQPDRQVGTRARAKSQSQLNCELRRFRRRVLSTRSCASHARALPGKPLSGAQTCLSCFGFTVFMRRACLE